MKQYIRQSELDEMPLEPRARFVAVYELANERFEEEISNLDQWTQIVVARIRYAAAILGFAKSLGIDEVAVTDFRPIRDNVDGAFESFELSLAHVVAQYMNENSLRANLESVELRGSVRDRLRTLAAAMREHVDKLDLSPQKQDALRRHIDAFEADLKGRRLPLIALAKLALAIALVSSELAEGAVAFLELHERIVHTVAEEKDQQDRERAPLLLEVPTTPASPLRITDSRAASDELASELDDEIPF